MTERRPPRKAPEYATEVYGRTPEFKQHNQLGHARSALRQPYGMWGCYGFRGGVLFRWDGNEWVEFERVEGPGVRK